MALQQAKLTHFDLEKENNIKANRKKVSVAKITSFVILLAFCIIWILPFFIMFAGSFRSAYDSTNFPKELFPPHSGWSVEMYKFLLLGIAPDNVIHNANQEYAIGFWILNSCFSAIGGTLLYLLVASMAAYVFVFVNWKGKNLLFYFLVGTMVIPGAATAVGNLQTVYNTGLNNSILALIIPSLGGIYGMYLIKTFFESIPKDLVESAKMDGCNNFKIFRKVVIPLGKTVLFVQGLFGFMAGWNDLVWPQMLFGTKDTKLWTLQVGMAYVINNSKTSDLIGTALAGGVICFVPVLIVYLIAQNKIIEGMATAGIKR
jgi:multiple sugar transport system permease protein